MPTSDVEAAIQCLDWCETRKQLRAVGNRIAADPLFSDEDKQALREVYRECHRAFRIDWRESNGSATETQV